MTASVGDLAPSASSRSRLVRLAFVGAASLALLYAALTLYGLGQPLFAAMVIALAVGFAIVFGAERFYATRFIFPGVAAILLFIAFPVIYTIWLGFTNYSSFNLLTFERVIDVHTAETVTAEGSERPFSLVEDEDGYRVFLPSDGSAGDAEAPEAGFLSEPVALDGGAVTVAAEPIETAPAETLSRRDAVRLRRPLAEIAVALPDGTELRANGLREFAAVRPLYERLEDDTLVNVVDGTRLVPDHERGFYVDEAGKRVPPGWRVNIGTDNFERVFESEGVRAPLVSIFLWTLVFATASVLLTFAVGLLLAVILQWPHLRFKALYRLLLILPYAVPSFISILVFRGIFNQNFGEVNLILQALFGIRPDWFTDATLARTMILGVNVWLGYPYMMLLAMGFLQGVPEDQKKAAALEGASALRVFFTITLPQILPPFLPLLIAAFAFNFNNLVLILLLTNGGPDIPGTVIPAGQTDILGSFTYRMAFDDSGQQFGLAGAITFLIFLVVGAIAYANFVAMRRAAARRA